MTRLGMDADAVESAGRALKAHADRIDGIIRALDRTVKSLGPVWEGATARRFVQQTWPEYRAMLVAAREHVAGLGQSALNNASEQRGVSSAKGSAPGAGAAASSVTTEDRWNTVLNAGDDGVRIQAIRGADGETRYVIYIGGTRAGIGNLNALDNSAERGQFTGTYADIYRQIAAAKIPLDADVMIYGYSQGGIHAQRLAAESNLHVTDVVTFGSPFYGNDQEVGGANIVRIHDADDRIPGTGIVNTIEHGASEAIDHVITGARALLGDSDGAVQHEVDRLNAGHNLEYTTHATGVNTTGLGSHEDPDTYAQGSRQYEEAAAQSAEGRQVLASQALYQGDVIWDSDSAK
jgi:uncharacterized protein YukE